MGNNEPYHHARDAPGGVGGVANGNMSHPPRHGCRKSGREAEQCFDSGPATAFDWPIPLHLSSYERTHVKNEMLYIARSVT
jgi:hypothetical protein